MESNKLAVLEDDSDEKIPPKYSWRSTRFYMALLLMFGLFARTCMRVDFSIAVVCMVNSTFSDNAEPLSQSSKLLLESESSSSKCHHLTLEEAVESGYNGEMEWDQKKIALLFSSSFYGMLTSILFAGYLVDRFNPRKLLIISTVSAIILTLMLPSLARYNFWAVFVARYLMGIGGAFVIPSMLAIASRWYPASERASFAAIYTSGNQLGAIVTLPISSFLCSSAFGWPSIFYFFGCLGCIWVVLWLCFSSNTPDDNKYVSEKEKAYINNAVGLGGINRKKDAVIPWRHILTSVPVFAGIGAQVSFSFSIILMQVYLPMFLKQVMMVSLKKNGFVSMMPFVMQVVFKNIVGNVGDELKKRKILSNTQAVKIFQITGNIGSAFCFLILAFFIDCNSLWLVMLTLALFGCFISCGVVGFFTALLSVAPRYTGIISSINLLIGSIVHSLVPTLVGFVNKNGTKEEWRIIFLVAVGLHIFGALIFGFFGSADVQPWAEGNAADVEMVEKEKLKEEEEVGENAAEVVARNSIIE